MKFTQWKNLRIDPTHPEMSVEEKLMAALYLTMPSVGALLLAISLGSKNEMYWAMAALIFGMGTAIWKMHPQSKSADWKKMFFLFGVPTLIVPISLEFGAEFWSWVVAFGVHFGVKFYYQHTQNKVG